ncbi:MAG: TetR/AcrR family transcriptional regulator [Pseudomonadota bacterium]
MRHRDPATLESLMRAAMDAFSVDGYHGVKINRICESAGVANGTFYLYFKSKEDIYEAVFKRAAEEYLAVLKAHEDDDLPPALADLRDVETIVEYAVRTPALHRTVLEDRKSMVKGVQVFREELLEQRTNSIKRGMKAGVFRSDIDPRLAALADIAITGELITAWLNNPRRISREHLVEQLWQFRMRLSYEPKHWQGSASKKLKRNKTSARVG